MGTRHSCSQHSMATPTAAPCCCLPARRTATLPASTEAGMCLRLVAAERKSNAPVHVPLYRGYCVQVQRTDVLSQVLPRRTRLTPCGMRARVLCCCGVCGVCAVCAVCLRVCVRARPCMSVSDRTPLIEASDAGHADAVKCLLAANSDVNHLSREKETALYCASNKGHTDIVELLVTAARGISFSANQVTNSGHTALSKAAAHGHLGIVRLLLSVRAVAANADQPVSFGWTALLTAAANGQEDVVKLLLAVQSVDINKTDKNNWSALYLSSRFVLPGDAL